VGEPCWVQGSVTNTDGNPLSGAVIEVWEADGPPLFHKLRDLLSYTNSLGIGDPPFACRELGANCGPGYCMSSLEIRILEFWYRTTVGSKWQREPRFEQMLADAIWNEASENTPPEPIFLRIHNSEKKDEWRRARERGDFEAMVRLLTEFGCERPADVANMVDLDFRDELARRDRWALTEARLGKGP
jgi:hypothetical protein